IQVRTWNIINLKDKSKEIVDIVIRRRWVGKQTTELDVSGLNLWYISKIRSRNGVSINVDKELKNIWCM
ncbi:hypothetical protein Lal_00028508, partial [Lupinus albus]